MKKKVYVILWGFLIIFLVFFCDKGNYIQNVEAILTENSACKSSKSAELTIDIPSDRSCIFYSYDKKVNKLSVKHANAGFNCCPGKLTCAAEYCCGTITITESEEAAKCNCDCLFDLEMEVTGVTAGDYKVKIIEPYSGDQEKIVFEVNLDDHPDGSFCVTRKLYPWGM
jgi:hypothetical protein